VNTYDTFKIHMAMYLREQAQTKLQVKKLTPFAQVPTRGTPVAAGLDLYALWGGVVPAGTTYVVSTGISIALPRGYEGQVRPRSGLAARHAVTVTNSPGTIDEDYRGELKVLVINHGSTDFEFKAGDRIAQLVITKANYLDVEEVTELDATERGDGGFGSTGR
jgi:dUTP pyrophosphatase